MTIGSAIRSARKESKVSLRKLAEGIGVDAAYLGRQERGLDRMNCETLESAAKFLGTTPSHLYQIAEGSERRWVDLVCMITELSVRLGVDFSESERRELAFELLDIKPDEPPDADLVRVAVQQKAKYQS